MRIVGSERDLVLRGRFLVVRGSGPGLGRIFRFSGFGARDGFRRLGLLVHLFERDLRDAAHLVSPLRLMMRTPCVLRLCWLTSSRAMRIMMPPRVMTISSSPGVHVADAHQRPVAVAALDGDQALAAAPLDAVLVQRACACRSRSG